MKTLKYYFIILQILGFFSIQGQDTTSLDDKISTATSLLPTSEITTDIFYNQVPEYFPFRFLDGINTGDSAYLDKEGFKLSYGMIANAYLDSFSYLSIDSLWNIADSLSNKEIVHLGSFYYDYHKLRDKALDTTVGWLNWDSTYFHDQSPQDSTLYEKARFYGLAGMKKKVAGPWVTFYLDSNLMFSNIGYDTATLEIDYDDGNGWQQLHLNDSVSVSYPVLDSIKMIRIRMLDTLGQWIYAQTPLFVVAQSQTMNHDFQVNPDGVIRLGQQHTFNEELFCCEIELENERLRELCDIRRNNTPPHLNPNVAV